jgi:hypothetical protein
MMRRAILGLLLVITALSSHALNTAAPGDVSIEGQWTVNVAASDDGERLLEVRMEEVRKEQKRFEEKRRRQMQNDPFAWEPEFSPPEQSPQFKARMEERDRSMRQMLGMTKFLNIKQGERGAKVELVSEFDTRRLTAGSRSQVSLPQGQLADLKTGWDGEWFVVERTSRDGPRITEKFRRLKKSDQLEALTTIRGDSMLSGMKLRRVFDRAVGEAPPINPSAGPIR